MKDWLSRLVGGRLQIVLITSFSVVAALSVGLSALVTSRLINDYLTSAQDERIARDMDLAVAFYQLKQDEVAAIGHRLALDPLVVENLPGASRGVAEAIQAIDKQITNKISVLALGGTHLIAVLDPQGDLIAGRVLSPEGEISPLMFNGRWGELPAVADVLASQEPVAATEVIPAEYLSQVDLDQQAVVPLIDTALAAPQPFDAREGTAGLTLTGVVPVLNDAGQTAGAVLAVYLFNNDFTLVDRIRDVAGVDTATIFFGDLRVSTNVMDQGERAVGTRVSQTVRDVVLGEGRDYVGRAFVVNEWFITRYVPLLDHLGQVVGSLYVGARASSFDSLVSAFNGEVALIALISMVLAGIIAVPIARLITRPIDRLVEANRRLEQGDMAVRVEPVGRGELAMLGYSFNSMVGTLQKTQQELLHKERLASMGQLAAGVAHEINNPLGTILLLSDAMRSQAVDQESRQDLKMIIDEATRCKHIVADLLNFARQQEVLAQSVDINALLDQVLETLERQPVFEGVEITRQFSPDPPVIQADPAQLQQVFVNLLLNAAEAMDGAGRISLATSLLDPDWVEIQVIDVGSGIPEENLGRLFTPFFTTKGPGKGTGLGLSIVYGIIKMHRGQISVRSEVGRGTTVIITLPVHLPRSQTSPADVVPLTTNPRLMATPSSSPHEWERRKGSGDGGEGGVMI